MNTMTIKDLFRANVIAIPLKTQEGFPLNPQPNFLVIDNIFSTSKERVYNINGELEEMICMNSLMKLVYREILPEENGKQEMIREVIMDNIGNLFIPMNFVPVLQSHEMMVQQEAVLNSFLPLFKFRGILKGFILKYDKEKSLEFLNYSEEPVVEPVVEEPTQEEIAPL